MSFGKVKDFRLVPVCSSGRVKIELFEGPSIRK
jgi:hypothetical protein